MLVISRKVGENIVIGNRIIEIEILDDMPGRVKLGITAPATVQVDRLEVYLAKQNGIKQRAKEPIFQAPVCRVQLSKRSG